MISNRNTVPFELKINRKMWHHIVGMPKHYVARLDMYDEIFKEYLFVIKNLDHDCKYRRSTVCLQTV